MEHGPFPPVLIDTGYQIPELTEYRNRLCREWYLDLLVGQKTQALPAGMGPEPGHITHCTTMKIKTLKQTITKHKWTAIIVGIRAGEEGTHAKEPHFPLRDKHGKWEFRDQLPELWDQSRTTFPAGSHIRVQALLGRTELNI